MKKHLLFLILCLMGILTSCSQKHTRYYIGVSQCSDDEWRHKMNHEIVREALFYDGVEVEIRTAKDNSRNQIEDINYFIDRKVDLLIVAPNEAAAVTPVVEKVKKEHREEPDYIYFVFTGSSRYSLRQYDFQSNLNEYPQPLKFKSTHSLNEPATQA
jgi:hypothetical protein